MLIETTATDLEQVRHMANAGRLYAVLDACDTPSVPDRAAGLDPTRAVCLYSGTAQEEYWNIAPYLFQVDDEVLDWILRDLWAEPWGVFAVAEVEFEVLRRHFKKFLVVQAPNGEQWYFRYYDPRVLTTFLPTCDRTQLDDLFGPISHFIIADPSGSLTSFQIPLTTSLTQPVSRPAPGCPIPGQIRSWI